LKLPDPLSNDLTLWAAFVGVVLPWLVGLIQRTGWPAPVQALVFGAAAFIAALITEIVRNGFDFTASGYFHTFLIVFFAALASYHLYWNRGGLIAEARAIGGKDEPPEHPRNPQDRR
jgi:hypothetical protein